MLHHAPTLRRWCRSAHHVATSGVRQRPSAPMCAAGKGSAGKGFGPSKAQPKKPKEKEEELPPELASNKMKRVKSKGKLQRRMGQPASQPPRQAVVQQQGAPGLGSMAAPDSGMGNLVDEIEFEERLKALKAEAEAKKQAVKAAQGSSGGGGQGNILDTPKRRQQEEDIYASPPSLGSTLFGKGKEEGKPDDYTGAKFGPGQVAAAVTSLALVGVFALTNGSSDLAYMMQPGPSAQQGSAKKVELNEELRGELEKQLAQFSAQLAEAPESTEALEGAAVVNARLGNYKEAVEQLQQLTAAKPSDPDVWRVLAESQSALGDTKAALESYRRAWQEVAAAPGAAPGGLEVLQSLAGELVAAGKEQQAVELVKEARGVVAAAQPDSSQEGSGSRLGAVEVELLLGKVYSQWRGHTSDALAVYDALTESRPDDFRGFLAKGLLLRDQGRVADAQRNFLQARYLAPKESRPAVDSIINRQR